MRNGGKIIKEGKGAYLYDYEGKKYLDWTS